MTHKPLNRSKLLELLDDFGLPYEETNTEVSINLDQVAGYFPFASDDFDTFLNFEFTNDGSFVEISIG